MKEGQTYHAISQTIFPEKISLVLYAKNVLSCFIYRLTIKKMDKTFGTNITWLLASRGGYAN